MRSYKLEQVAGQISRLTLDLNVINMAVDQEAILWSGLMDSEIAINVKTGSGERAFTFT